jgi:rSAM/selenodomain-associated transferase 2
MMTEFKDISFIIPALNEENNIKACIESVKRLNPFEIIVVDGGSTDRTKEIAENQGAFVIQSPRGRGIQMNTGASLAKGNIFLFLHADSVISEYASYEKIFNHDFSKYIGGFFKLKFNDNSASTRLVEFFANLRARLFSLPYGDQALFIRKDIFKKIGGFKAYPFLEDIDIALRLRKYGKLKYVPIAVIASPRRIKRGYPLSPILISLRNAVIALLFLLGVSPNKLVAMYK